MRMSVPRPFSVNTTRGQQTVDVGFVAQPLAVALEHQGGPVEQPGGTKHRLEAGACRSEQRTDHLSRAHQPQLHQPRRSAEGDVVVSDRQDPSLQ